MEMRCVTCGKSVLGPQGVTLFRQNEVGHLPALWACAEHNLPVVDPLVQSIVSALEGKP